MSNLRLINETSGTSVSSISVTDVFTSDFDIYKITFDCDRTVDQANRITFINTSGSEITSGSYDYGTLQLTMNTSFTERRDINGTYIQYFLYGLNYNSATIYVFNPYSNSSYTFILFQGVSDPQRAWKGIGVLKTLDSIGGIKITSNSGTYDTINLKTYGLRVDG